MATYLPTRDPICDNSALMPKIELRYLREVSENLFRLNHWNHSPVAVCARIDGSHLVRMKRAEDVLPSDALYPIATAEDT